ncbi:hypothetical protein N3M33_004942 [Escherichia coli]|nr:hypothetical protein [Escherichia coli]
MLKVYSESLMDLQEYLKHVEINGNRGMIYSMVVEILIKIVLVSFHVAENGTAVPGDVYKGVIKHLGERYSCLREPDIFNEVQRVVLLILDNREDLAYKLAHELADTSQHGGQLKYNVVDLVACRYWYTQPEVSNF